MINYWGLYRLELTEYRSILSSIPPTSCLARGCSSILYRAGAQYKLMVLTMAILDYGLGYFLTHYIYCGCGRCFCPVWPAALTGSTNQTSSSNMSVLLGFLAFLKDVFVFTVRLGLDLLCIALAIPVAVGTKQCMAPSPTSCVLRVVQSSIGHA